jgi:CBS domain-containing protein
MRVKDVMTAKSLKFCTPETNLHDAARTMAEANCGALPVVDSNRKVKGIVTDRDICLSLAKNTETPIGKRVVGDIMSKNVETIKGSDEITQAYRSMREKKIGRLPVVDEQGKLEGILSLNKMLNQSVRNGQGNLGTIDEPGENLFKTLHAISKHHEAKVLALQQVAEV